MYQLKMSDILCKDMNKLIWAAILGFVSNDTLLLHEAYDAFVEQNAPAFVRGCITSTAPLTVVVELDNSSHIELVRPHRSSSWIVLGHAQSLKCIF